MLLKRFSQFARAVVDLFLQIRIRFLQSAGHIVELICECLDLIASLDGDTLRKVAAANARRAGTQRLDRHHHPSGEEHAGHERERERPE